MEIFLRFSVQATENSVVDATFLGMLGLGEAHSVILGVGTILVGEDYHEILSAIVLLQFIRQPLQSILVGDSTFTGSNDYKHMVFGDVGS